MGSSSQMGMMRSFSQRRPRVQLEWDSAQNKVVAAAAQVGLSWKQANGDTPGSDSHPRLVDGFDIPKELLELPNLNDILSVETWETCLTDAEREYLSMYLPEGCDPESTVKALLSGENIHFGNPAQKWGEAVCAGEMHPDALLQRETKIKREQSAYCKSLRTYHGNMVQNLQKMKEIWEEYEDPEEFLPQIRRFGVPGQASHGSQKENALHPGKRNAENADLKKRRWNEIEEAVDVDNDIPARPKAKKQRVNKLALEGSKRLVVKSPQDETKKLNITQLEEVPNRLKVQPTGKVKESPVRVKAKGGKVNHSEDVTKMLTIKTSGDGVQRLKIKTPEEGSKRSNANRLEEVPKGRKIKSDDGVMRVDVRSAEEGTKRLQMKPMQEGIRKPKLKSEEGSNRLEAKLSEDGNKGVKKKLQGQGTKRLTIKPSGDGGKRVATKSSEEESKRLQIRPLDNEKDMLRPTAKQPKVKLSGRGKRLETKQREEGAKKPQIKLSEAGKKSLQTIPIEEERDPSIRPKARRSKAKPSEEGETQRLKIKSVDEGSQRPKTKPSLEETKMLKIKPSEEATRILPIRGPRGGKRSKVKPAEEGPQRPKISSLEEEKHVLPRPKGSRRKVNPPEQGTKRLQTKPKKKGQEHDLISSDFEGEWFKQYVQVTVRPISGQKLSRSIQSVKVTTKMFKDVKRRSEAGEEVHLDTLEATEDRSGAKPASKKAGGPSGNELQVIAIFWQTVVLKDLPQAHTSFMERKEEQQNLAMSLASSCKNLWEMEVSNIEAGHEYQSEGYSSPSGGYASPGSDYASQNAGYGSQSPGEASPSVGEASPSVVAVSPSEAEASVSDDEASPRRGVASPSEDEGSPSGDAASPSVGEGSPSGGEGSPSDGEGSPSGGEGSPSGGEGSPSGGDALPSEDEPWPSGDERSPTGDEAVPSGYEALQSGDEVSQSEDEASPSEADLEHKWV